METLILRLSGPEQSWGEQARFLKRTTLQVPTFSALIGMLRASLGHGMEDTYDDVSWLYELEYAVRIEQVGSQLSDYHTVTPRKNALPRNHRDYEKESKTLGTIPTGSGKPWVIGGEFQNLLTERHYIQDAVFTCFVSGEDTAILKLSEALNNPKWQLSLGRKRCVPDWTLVLGISNLDLRDSLASLPTISKEKEKESLEVQFLNPKNNRGTLSSDSKTVTYNDRAVGSHPQDGYIPNLRAVESIAVPTVKTRIELLSYAKNNLKNSMGVNNV